MKVRAAKTAIRVMEVEPSGELIDKKGALISAQHDSGNIKPHIEIAKKKVSRSNSGRVLSPFYYMGYVECAESGCYWNGSFRWQIPGLLQETMASFTYRNDLDEEDEKRVPRNSLYGCFISFPTYPV
jgi:hypothetical protein